MRELVEKIGDLAWRWPKLGRKYERWSWDFLNWYSVKYKKAVYYQYSSTDCDLVTRAGVGMAFDRKEFESIKKGFFESAEGPTSIHEITKSEYEYGLEIGPYYRDHITEAWENGDHRKVIL